MKKVLTCFVFAGVLAGMLISSPLAHAQTITKFGYFDLYRVMNQSKRWAKEREAFVKRGTELKKTFDRKKEELNAIRESLEKKGAMLNDQARKEKERDYQQKAKDLDRLGQDSDTELKQMDKEMSERFMLNLNRVIKKLGEDGKYSLIIEAGAIAYAAKEFDITDQVIKAFDAGARE
jgi:outer membrane protein